MPTLIYRLLYLVITDWLDMESEAGFSSGPSLSAPAGNNTLQKTECEPKGD